MVINMAAPWRFSGGAFLIWTYHAKLSGAYGLMHIRILNAITPG